MGGKFIDWVAPGPGQRWIDVGCGNGAFTALLVDRCTPSELHGVDPAAGQLDYARTRLSGSVAEFHEGTADSLPFPDDRFDVAVMALVIFFVPDPAGKRARDGPRGETRRIGWRIRLGRVRGRVSSRTDPGGDPRNGALRIRFRHRPHNADGSVDGPVERGGAERTSRQRLLPSSGRSTTSTISGPPHLFRAWPPSSPGWMPTMSTVSRPAFERAFHLMQRGASPTGRTPTRSSAAFPDSRRARRVHESRPSHARSR